MCYRDFTDEEEEQIFETLRERFPAEWDVDISWGQPLFDFSCRFDLIISKAQVRAIIGSKCDCDDCDQIQ